MNRTSTECSYGNLRNIHMLRHIIENYLVKDLAEKQLAELIVIKSLTMKSNFNTTVPLT